MCTFNKLMVVVLGGDDRELEVVKHLIANGADVRVCGRDDVGILGIETNDLEQALKSANVVVGPVRGIGSDGTVFTKSCIQLRLTREHLMMLAGGACILTGRASEEFRKLAKTTHVKVIEYGCLDDFAIYNAIPTAEAAIEIALRELPITIHRCQALILGFGKVGDALGMVLKAMGAVVTVYNRSPAPRARAYQMGLMPTDGSGLAVALKNTDVVFNTIPALILDQHALMCMKPGTLIIDLASEPGGIDFESAGNLGLNAIHALGLPGKTAPVTAGRIAAKIVHRLIEECCSP